jgi:uncharacterized protein (TIGR03086 family)
VDGHGALDIATAGFARTLRLVGPGGWNAATPNPGWTVRDLVNHVVGGNRRYSLLLAGAPMDEVEALRDLNHLTDDPHTDFVTTAAEVSAAFRSRGALERAVHHRLGDRYGAELLVMRISEHALHGWDLAHAISQDPTIDLPVVDTLLAAVAADPTSLERSGFTSRSGAEKLVGVARLLALTGRS